VLTKAPELIQFVEAEYPEAAREAKLEGEVVLLVEIDETGAVMNAEVISSAGHGFDEAAAAAVRQFRFSPAEIDGLPAAVQIEYVYRFVFRPSVPPPVEDSAEAIDAAPTTQSLPVTLRGRAIERASRKPIGRALLRCRPLSDEAAAKVEKGEKLAPSDLGTSAEDAPTCGDGLPEETDADGFFELRLAPGHYVLELLSPGHETLRRAEWVREGEVLDVTYHLMPTLSGRFHSVVRGERERREATRRTLEREEIQAIPGTMGDAVRVIHNLPGVARSAYLGGQMVVRGASPSETGSYLDGVEIPLLFHFFGGPSVINSEFIDRIDFLPGGFGPRYGNATGGIVDAHTRRGTSEGIHGNFKIDFIDAAFFGEAALGEKTTLALAARRSYVDAFLSAVMPETESLGTVSILPRYWDYQLRLDHGLTSDRHQFTVMLFGSDDQMAVSTSGGERDLELDLGGDVSFHRLKLGWTFRDGAFTNVLAPWIGLDLASMDTESDELAGFAVEGKELRVGLREEATYAFERGHRARLGLDLRYTHAWMSGEIPFSTEYRPLPGASYLTEPVEMDRAYDALNAGLYHEWELALFDGKLRLLPGVRLELFAMRDVTRWALDPRLNARFQIAEGTTLKGNVGLYSQIPDLAYFDADFGNPDLGFSKAIQTSLGVEQKLGMLMQGLSIDVTGFFIHGFDRVASSDEMVRRDDGTLRSVRYVNAAFARNYGVEVLVRQELTERLFGWIAYTLSRSERRLPDEERFRRSSYDQAHILIALLQYKLNRGWSLGARFRLVSGNPTTPITGSTFDADTGRYEAIRGELYSERAPVFHQLDLRVDKEWTFKTWKLGVYLDIQNVYWADNTEYVLWDYRYRGSTSLPGMPFFPSLGIKGSF
jgi:TonB family protein